MLASPGMRGWFHQIGRALGVLALLGCGASTTTEAAETRPGGAETTAPGPTAAREPASDETAVAPLEAGDDAPGDDAPSTSDDDAAGGACTSSGDCTHSSLPSVAAEADCACPGCGGPAVSLARLSEIAARYEAVCGAWRRAHDCPPTVCAERHERSLCVGGECLDEPVAQAGSGAPPPCAHPGDCPGRAACVTHALGGEVGCTNETCCGAAECGNGCASDADCPACRPHCREGSCRSESGAP